MSTGVASSPRWWRNHSRTRRLKRLRCTEGPALRPTVIPRRLVGPGWAPRPAPRASDRPVVRVAMVTTTSSGRDRRRPARSTRWKSRPSSSLSDGLKPPVFAVRSFDRPADTLRSRLLGRDRDGDPLATLRAASAENGAAALGLHSFPESVRSKPLDPARLKCPLHACGSSLSGWLGLGLFGPVWLDLGPGSSVWSGRFTRRRARSGSSRSGTLD